MANRAQELHPITYGTLVLLSHLLQLDDHWTVTACRLTLALAADCLAIEERTYQELNILVHCADARQCP